MTIRSRGTRTLMAAMTAVVALAFTLTAYGATAPLTKLHIAMVPSLDAEPYLYAQAQGYYKDAGLDVTFASNHAGPAVITGVINGTYDAAVSSWFPFSIAVSKGAKLKIVMSVNVQKLPGHGEGGLIVKSNSGITSYKDLEGKTVATNALTSLNTLALKMRMKAAGANPDTIKIVALPFKTAVQAVAQGEVDAGVVITPFAAEAQDMGLKLIADPIQEAFPADSIVAVLFTSHTNAHKKAKAFAAYTKATLRAAAELRGNPALQRKLAHTLVGVSKEVAQKVQLPNIATQQPINLKLLQNELDVAYQWGYLGRPLKAKDVVLGE